MKTLQKICPSLIFLSIYIYTAPAQDLSLFDHFNDSIRNARKLDSIALVSDSIARLQLAIDPDWDRCALTSRDSMIIDSFERKITALDLQWSASKRLRDITDGAERIRALMFFDGNHVHTPEQTMKFSRLLRAREETELAGTEYLMTHQCGKEKLRAVAHRKKVLEHISALDGFFYLLSNKKPEIKTEGKRKL